MALWLIVVVTAGFLFIWRCKSLLGRLPSRKRKLNSAERILIVTAHPDDECMFFGPLVVTATRKWSLEVFVLCCSTGDHYGAGEIRRKELLDACFILGVPACNVRCVDDPLLPDDPTVEWNQNRLRLAIVDAVRAWKPTMIVTFDEKGVSGHSNHSDVAKCLIAMKKSRVEAIRGCRLLLLETVNPLRKYMKYLDVAITFQFDFDLMILANSEHSHLVATAMRAHSSQLMWFRWLYIFFSRYMLVNTFREVFETSAGHLTEAGSAYWPPYRLLALSAIFRQENRTIHALGERCKESTVLKNQLNAEIRSWRDILVKLQLLSNRVRDALAWTKVTLEINHEIVNLLVKAIQDLPDFLMKAIKDEAMMIIQRSDELTRMEFEIRRKEMEANQIRCQLEGFWSDKSRGLELDNLALGLSVDSRFATFKPLAEGTNLSTHHNPEGDSLYRISDIVKRSQALRDLHLKFLSDADRGISFTASAAQAARDKLVSALDHGSRLGRRMKELNQEQLLATKEERERMKKDYLDLRNAVHDNNRPLMLAETRLFTRAQKPIMDQEDDETNKALLDQLHTIQKVYRDNILPMKSLQRGIQDLLDNEIDISRSIELVNNKLLTAYERCTERGRFYPTSKQLLGWNEMPTTL